MIEKLFNWDKLECLYRYMNESLRPVAMMPSGVYLTPSTNLYQDLNWVFNLYSEYFKKFNSIHDMIAQFDSLNNGSGFFMCLTDYGGDKVIVLLHETDDVCIIRYNDETDSYDVHRCNLSKAGILGSYKLTPVPVPFPSRYIQKVVYVGFCGCVHLLKKILLMLRKVS